MYTYKHNSKIYLKGTALLLACKFLKHFSLNKSTGLYVLAVFNSDFQTILGYVNRGDLESKEKYAIRLLVGVMRIDLLTTQRWDIP